MHFNQNWKRSLISVRKLQKYTTVNTFYGKREYANGKALFDIQ